MAASQHLAQNPQAQVPTGPQLSVLLAQDGRQITQAQQLRYQVFKEEYGAKLDHPLGIDEDELDPYCEHLVVLDSSCHQVVATTRLLTHEKAEEFSRFYSESEFDLERIKRLPGRFLELGRTCVHADYRAGSALSLLWSGLAATLLKHQYDYLIGSASISMHDGGRQAHGVAAQLREKHLLDAEYAVTPKLMLPRLNGAAVDTEAAIPPLLKAYLRIGAKVGGEPCWDPEFRTADLFMVLDMNDVPQRYIKHFMRIDTGDLRAARGHC